MKNKSKKNTQTGMGLTFCKLAIEAHECQIWAESKDNFGATFTFSIPILKEDYYY